MRSAVLSGEYRTQKNTNRDSISGGRLFVNGKELPISKYRREELLNTIVYKKLISK
ncbi:hypothetical protein M2132_002000 [Dysgonomonas sp. PH5-45]|nr:hypothetical protein [Dysgonomonas sp. PH5-45]MDH6388562.1 hypothetical protein [Dysgonomonas sp. PH5-37]